MSARMPVTGRTITDLQISRLRDEAANAGDYMQIAICDLALGGAIRADDYSTLSHAESRRLRDMSQRDAIAACVEAARIAAAQ